MFYNLEEVGHMQGAYDQWSLHAGCKPLNGPKYISNKWVRNKQVDGKLYVTGTAHPIDHYLQEYRLGHRTNA